MRFKNYKHQWKVGKNLLTRRWNTSNMWKLTTIYFLMEKLKLKGDIKDRFINPDPMVMGNSSIITLNK